MRVVSQGWDDAKVILADQALDVTGMGKTPVAARVQRDLEFLNVELTGLAARPVMARRLSDVSP